MHDLGLGFTKGLEGIFSNIWGLDILFQDFCRYLILGFDYV